MELKVGQTITCKKERFVGNDKCTTINKDYEIVDINKYAIIIIDDEGDEHNFILDDKKHEAYLGKYFTTEPPKKERYFIVFYKGDNIEGNLSFISNEYPNRTETMEVIKKDRKTPWAIIVDIQELNQQDYESWNK